MNLHNPILRMKIIIIVPTLIKLSHHHKSHDQQKWNLHDSENVVPRVFTNNMLNVLSSLPIHCCNWVKAWNVTYLGFQEVSYLFLHYPKSLLSSYCIAAPKTTCIKAQVRPPMSKANQILKRWRMLSKPRQNKLRNPTQFLKLVRNFNSISSPCFT